MSTPAPAPASSYVVDPDGQIVEVDPALAPTLAESGYSPASPEQVGELETQKKFGTPGQQAITMAEGLARGLTFGLSTPVETHVLGVPAENIKGRQQANPIASAGSELAGMGAGLFIPGSAPALAGKLGKLGAGAVEKALPKATSLVGQLAERALASGAGSAIEGAAYGLGQTVHEDALGDPNLTAQSALAHVGLSAALFGGIGAAGGIVGGLLGKAAESAPAWLRDFESAQSARQLGATKGQMEKLTERYGLEGKADILDEAREAGLFGALTRPKQALENAQAFIRESANKMKPIMEQLDAKAAADPLIHPDGQAIFNSARKSIIKPLLADPLSRPAGEKLEGLLTEYGVRISENKPSYLLDLRRRLDDAINYSRSIQDLPDLADGYFKFRRMVSQEIKDTLGRAGMDVGAWNQLNRNIAIGATIAELAEKGAGKEVHNIIGMSGMLGAVAGSPHGFAAGVIGGVGSQLAKEFAPGLLGAGASALRHAIEGGAAATAAETVTALSLLERTNQAVAKTMDNAASALVRGVRGVGTVAQVGRNEAAAGVGKVFGQTPEDASKDFAKVAEQIQTFHQNPEHTLDALTKQTDDLYEHAPNTAQAMQTASARAISFLASKLPTTPDRGPLASKWEPSRGEIAKFNRYYEAVNDPATILQQAAAGTLTPEAVEAVKTVYPQLYQKMQATAVERLAGHIAKGGTIPYRSKLMLSMLFGSNMDGSTTPSMVLHNQMAITAAPEQSGPANPNPSARGVEKLTLAQRSLTPMQASAQRSRK